jgi:subtilisin family serine protease
MRTRNLLFSAGAIIGVGVLMGGAWWFGHVGRSSVRSSPPPAAPTAITPSPLLAATTPPPATGCVTGVTTHATPSVTPSQTDDPTASMPVLASQEIADPTTPGLIRRIRIVKSNFKYPLWRVEEVVRQAPSGQPDAILSRNIMIADHAMIRLTDMADITKLQTLVTSLGLTIRKNMKMPGCYLISIAEESTEALPRLLAMLNENKDLIRYAEPDYIVRSQQTVPNDPQFGSLWGLYNAARPGSDISAPQAWDWATGDTQVVIAVIDTGIDYTHPDLANNIWSNTAESANGLDNDGNGYTNDVRGWNFSEDNNNPMDSHSHGTHCAGTIGAIGNNGTGVAGVNWRCKIMALKFLDNSGSGTDSDAADALHYVADLKRRGVNIRLTSNSWGGGDYTITLRDAIRENNALGILLMAAAGNSGINNDITPFYPASYTESNIIAVAATTSSDGLATFSHYGASSVDLGAPGVDIRSTVPGAAYAPKNGTSMATPHVAGVATLLWNAWPEASLEDIRDAILRGTDPLPALSGKTVTGGRLNAYKALKTLFRIVHTPLEDTFNSGADYPVRALIGPAILNDTNQASLFWNADGSTNYTSISLIALSNTCFEAAIPAHPEGTTIQYWLQAVSRSNQTLRIPSNAPLSTYTFKVVSPITLTVTGSPSALDSVTPSYGLFNYPSGKVFLASAPVATAPTNGTRWRCTGWTGSGSVPETGFTNRVTFTLTNSSTLSWQWGHEVALVQTSLVSTILNKTFWYADGSTATSQTATATVTAYGTNYTFIGWTVDGLRQPDSTHAAVNPVTGIIMTAPRVVEALYLPTTRDADNDGLADGWECFYFGTTNINLLEDADGDGYMNRDEFRDRTDPRDPLSFPRPPVIQHSALINPQSRPAPFTITATITDNYTVASAIVMWTRNGEGTTFNAMIPGIANDFSFTLPAPGSNGDTFVYSIIASDLQSSSTNGPNTFTILYPIVTLSPSSLEATLLPETTRTLSLSTTNSGGAESRSELSILWGGHSNSVESGAAGWNHSGTVDLWTLSTNRSTSGSTAWYCGDPATRTYGSSMHAKLDTPPIMLPTGAQLSFRHWIQSELDGQFWRIGWNYNDCWDGGIVEISTNLGVSFQQITPIGGYPNLISGYAASPWPDLTPCFAGTGSWSQAAFNLAAFTGSVAIIRFHFGSDDNTEEEGWYLDDIVISPVVQPQSWLSLATDQLTLPANSGNVAPAITLNSAGIPTGERQSTLFVSGNDPVKPYAIIPIRMTVRSPATLTWQTASQTSTNGTGLVTLGNQLCDADGDICQMACEWSTSAGGPWSNLWLTAVQADAGTAWLDNAQSPSISNLITLTDSGLITNTLSATWNSQTSGCGGHAASNTLVRGRTWDGLFWSSWVTSQPFMVDNEAPPTPTNLTINTHVIAGWNKNPSIILNWDPVTDGSGIGLKDYLHGAGTNLLSFDPSGTTTNRKVTIPSPGDGTNIWVWVRAQDNFGNLSAAAYKGPYWIDANPPSSAGATLSLTLSPFGNYCIGVNSVTGSWSGFTDSGTGIEGYYLSLQDGGGTTNGAWQFTTTGVFNTLVMNQTNTAYVWGRDKMGWIGQAAKVAFLALSPEGDWDHDGVSNAGEDIAGTDASRASSFFRLGVTGNSIGNENGFVIQWAGLSNRHYSVSYNDRLTSGSTWVLLPGGANLPGTNGVMSLSDPTTAPVRFYRISVSRP